MRQCVTMDHEKVKDWIMECYSERFGGHVHLIQDCIIQTVNGCRIAVENPPEDVLEHLQLSSDTDNGLRVYLSVPPFPINS